MKTRKEQLTRAARALVAGSVIVTLTLLAAWQVWSQTSAPGLSIALTGTNEVTLTVTNGVPTGVYEIWWTEFLGSYALSLTNGAWQPICTNMPGQTNFVMDLGDTYTGFFRALNGTDFDNDGIPDWEDARPFDPSIGILRVTIESPANGSNVQ